MMNTAQYVEKCRKWHGAIYDLKKVKYRGSVSKITIGCPTHGWVEIQAGRFGRGFPCPTCARNSGAKKRAMGDATFFNRMGELHPLYDFSDSSYLDCYTDISVGCPTHGEFTIEPLKLLAGQKCPKCSILAVQSTQYKSTSYEVFLDKAYTTHGDKYTYDANSYVNIRSQVSIICPEHGPFVQCASSHLVGAGCPTCARHKVGNDRMTGNVMIEKRIMSTHGDSFSYPHGFPNRIGDKMTVTCPTHGNFEQRASAHIDGRGCPKCTAVAVGIHNTHDTSDFINAAYSVHGNHYSYTNVVYNRSTSHVAIGCPIHGEFNQLPYVHLRGSGCPKCKSKSCSMISQKWLDSIGIPDIPSCREVGGLIPEKNYIVDGYDPDTNTVYEFHGDFWHGNPRVFDENEVNPIVGIPFGELYTNTRLRINEFRQHGYNIVEMWEYDYSL